MEVAFLKVLPLIAVGLAGYLAVRFELIGQAANDGIARFVFAIALPAYIFKTLAKWGPPTNLTLMWKLAACYFVGALIVMVVGMFVSKSVFNGGGTEQNTVGICASHSNVVLLGFPAVIILLGSKQLIPLFLLIGIHGLAMAVLLTVVLQLRKGGTGALPQALSRVAITHLKTPLLLAVIAGLLYFSLKGPAIPKGVLKGLNLLSGAAIPCALFAVGGLISRYKITAVSQDVIAMTALKLAAFPAIVWALAKYALGMPGSWTWLAVTLAMAPTAYRITGSEKKTQDVGGTAGAVTGLSTILSAVALVALIYIIRGGK